MPSENKERQKALSEARGQAMKRLMENHADEFNKFMVEEAAARSEKWAPRPGPADKAAKQIAVLLEQYPELAKQYGVREENDAIPEAPA